MPDDICSPTHLTLPAESSLPAWARQHNQPLTYPRLFLEVANRRGFSEASVLREAGLPALLLSDPAGRLTVHECWRIYLTVYRLTGDPALGFEAGQHAPLTAHGSLGIALMCAATPRQALGILARYWHLRGRGLTLNVQETENAVLIEISPELPTPAALMDFILPCLLTSIARGISFVAPEVRDITELWLKSAEPAGFDAWRATLPIVRFNMPTTGVRVVGFKERLDQPLATSTPEGLASALAQCERETLLMGGGTDPVLQRARAALQAGAEGYPSAADIARLLHMTPRTFRRRLQEQGSNYRQLLEEARKRDSCHLLEKPELEIRQISAMLGYADPANFTRAFRSWTGSAPQAWRKSLGIGLREDAD